MRNRSRQGIQLTKQRSRDKLLAEPILCSYFTEALLSIGTKKGKKKEEKSGSETERAPAGRWGEAGERGRQRRRAKEQRKMFPPSNTNLWMNNSISFQRKARAVVPSLHTAATLPTSVYPFAHLRHERPYKSHMTRVYNQHQTL